MERGELTVYRGCTPVVDAEYRKNNGQSPSSVIIDAVAEAAGVDVGKLSPLYEYVDPEALDDLFEAHDGIEYAEALLSFKIDTWNVFVRADGKIRVCDATRPTDPQPVFGSNTV